jgi:hypothetical protein
VSLATFTWLWSNKWVCRGANGNEPWFHGMSECIDFEMPLDNQHPVFLRMWLSCFKGFEEVSNY